MKKDARFLAIAALMVFSLISSQVSAQEIQKGDFILSPSLGFGYWYAGSGFPISIGVNGEYAFTDEISGGGYLSYTRWTNDYGFSGSNYDYKYTFIDFGVRASYHFAKLLKVSNKKFDPYAGANLGFVSSSYDYDGPGGSTYSDVYDGGVRVGVYAGARYYFQPNIGVFGEVSTTLAPLSIGVTFKF